jgi:hypothetical protein
MSYITAPRDVEVKVETYDSIEDVLHLLTCMTGTTISRVGYI